MDATETKKPDVGKVSFPSVDIRDCLIAELTALAESEAAMFGIDLATSATPVVKLAIRLDSLSVVDVLCAVEPIIGFPLRESIVKTGGYASIDAAIDHMMPRLEAAWAKKNGVTA